MHRTFCCRAYEDRLRRVEPRAEARSLRCLFPIVFVIGWRLPQIPPPLGINDAPCGSARDLRDILRPYRRSCPSLAGPQARAHTFLALRQGASANAGRKPSPSRRRSKLPIFPYVRISGCPRCGDIAVRRIRSFLRTDRWRSFSSKRQNADRERPTAFRESKSHAHTGLWLVACFSRERTMQQISPADRQNPRTVPCRHPAEGPALFASCFAPSPDYSFPDKRWRFRRTSRQQADRPDPRASREARQIPCTL